MTSLVSETLTSISNVSVTVVAATDDAPENDNDIAMIGGIVGGIVALLLVVGLIVFLVARKRRESPPELNSVADGPLPTQSEYASVDRVKADAARHAGSEYNSTFLSARRSNYDVGNIE
jgi:hypothetical protein